MIAARVVRPSIVGRGGPGRRGAGRRRRRRVRAVRGRRHADRRAGRPARFVDETAAAGLDHTYDGDSTFSVGGGVAVFDCNGDGRPDIYLAGGSNPAALYRNDSPVGGALRFTRLHDPATDLTDVDGRLPDRHRRRRQGGPGGPARRRERPPARPRRLPLRAGQRGLGVRRRQRLDHRLQRQVGGLGAAADARLRQLPRARCRPASRRSTAPTTRSSGRTPTGDGLRAADRRSTPGYCTLSMLFSDWDRSGRRDLRMTNDRQLLRRRPGPALAGRARASRRACTPTRTAGSRCRSGAWASPATTSPATATRRYFLTSQGDNKLQTLTTGPGQPTYRDIALKRGVDRRPAVHRRRRPAFDRLAPRVPGRQQRRLHRPVHLEGQRQRERRLRREGPEQPAPRPARRDLQGGRRRRRRS